MKTNCYSSLATQVPAGPPERETNGNLHHKFYEKLNVGSFLPWSVQSIDKIELTYVILRNP